MSQLRPAEIFLGPLHDLVKDFGRVRLLVREHLEQSSLFGVAAHSADALAVLGDPRMVEHLHKSESFRLLLIEKF